MCSLYLASDTTALIRYVWDNFVEDEQQNVLNQLIKLRSDEIFLEDETLSLESGSDEL